MGVLRDQLEPTDFSDSQLKVTRWHSGNFYSANAYRVWMCTSNGHWFQRHEWAFPHRNSTELEEWHYLGHYTRKFFPPHFEEPQ